MEEDLIVNMDTTTNEITMTVILSAKEQDFEIIIP